MCACVTVCVCVCDSVCVCVCVCVLGGGLATQLGGDLSGTHVSGQKIASLQPTESLQNLHTLSIYSIVKYTVYISVLVIRRVPTHSS